jgi:hypothetical protein
MLNVYWIGYGGSSYLAEELRPIIQQLGMTFFTIHEHANADIQWGLDSWKSHLSKADIVVLPANFQTQPAKSCNRLTQSMALGKPVICSPLQAYLDIEKDHPGSFLIARTKEEWKEHLTQLRDDENLRKDLSQKALTASKDYSIDVIGAKWVSALIEDKEPIDIIITTYNNIDYLKLCLDSIMRNTDIAFNIIISDAGSDDVTWSFLKALKKENYASLKLGSLKVLGKNNERKNYSETCNAGIQNSVSKYFVILNSDVIVSKGWLSNMVSKMKTDKAIAACGVLSNCDRGWLFQ